MGLEGVSENKRYLIWGVLTVRILLFRVLYKGPLLRYTVIHGVCCHREFRLEGRKSYDFNLGLAWP